MTRYPSTDHRDMHFGVDQGDPRVDNARYILGRVSLGPARCNTPAQARSKLLTVPGLLIAAGPGSPASVFLSIPQYSSVFPRFSIILSISQYFSVS